MNEGKWGVPTFDKTSSLVSFFLLYFPSDSSQFISHNYWRGPAWINTGWILVKGLRRYENLVFGEYADALRQVHLYFLLFLISGLFADCG